MKQLPRLMAIITVLAGLLAGGCMSTRMTFEGRPKVTLPAKVPCRYNLETVVIGDGIFPEKGSPPERPSPRAWWTNPQVGRTLRERAEARYPQLFSHDPAAIPVTLQGKYTRERHDTALCLTAMLTLGTLPWPGEYDCRLDWLLIDQDGQPAGQFACRTKMGRWISLFTPLGLIPVPGPSDVPKSSDLVHGTIVNLGESEVTHLMNATADALAAQLLKTDPARLQTPPATAPTTGPAESLTPDAMPLPNF